MIDYIRETLSYGSIYRKYFRVKREYTPECIEYGSHMEQYFLYYEPNEIRSDKIIVWIHGGGWNSGSPKFFDYVGQCVAKEGYRFISIGYRLSPLNKYPAQIKDVCAGYNRAMAYLKDKGVDTSKVIVAGPSAGAHLGSIMCYCKRLQDRCHVDVSNIIGFIGSGGPYYFSGRQNATVRLLLDQLFKKGYDRRRGEPVRLMTKNHIPMLLIQSKHDGLIDFSCAEVFARKAHKIGNKCRLYSVEDKKNTHSWYTAGMFLESRSTNKGLDMFFSWIEER